MRALAAVDERTESGASAVEYGLLVAGIAASCLIIIFAFGGVIQEVFASSCDDVGQSSGSDC